MIETPIYVVIDVELDGLVLGRHSMLSFASVAVTPDGYQHGEFEAIPGQLDGASPVPETMAFWKAQPEAYTAATRNPELAGAVMKCFADSVRSLAGNAIFAALPLRSMVPGSASICRG